MNILAALILKRNIHLFATKVTQCTLFSCFYFSHSGELAGGKSPFLKILMDAEAAANSAAIQLVSFKEAMEEEFAVCCCCIKCMIYVKVVEIWTISVSNLKNVPTLV